MIQFSSKTIVTIGLTVASSRGYRFCMSFQILALNAAGFDKGSFNIFPAAREKASEDFLESSERNVSVFRKAAEKEGIPFTHAVTFGDQDEAIAELRKRYGEIDYVVCEAEETPGRSRGKAQIVAYVPI